MAGVVPRWLILLGDWSNILAGLILCVAFGLVCAVFTFQIAKISDVAEAIDQTFFWEGFFWALAALCLTCRNVMEENAYGAVSQTIIMFGGLFFMVSGIHGVPSYVISYKYLIPWEAHVKFADVCPYYGITCFMVATSMGLYSVRMLPKNKLVSPFWGVAGFFLGAWLIGVFGFWGPCLLGGNESYDHLAAIGKDMSEMPTFTPWVRRPPL
eukprot:TRINITY_DN7068_c0_g1_i2.p2 TRINITY_DN7068_c0_g1~~TRINITY_DN7068_c0_g1_i2.p2  ORF type:complete len:233 (-),score=33.04 TRINITY_DN7068_c0_g1_i2:300-932(-)